MGTLSEMTLDDFDSIFAINVRSVFIMTKRAVPHIVKNKGNICQWFGGTTRRISHVYVTKWKYFPRYRPFVRGIHRSPVNSPHKGQWCGALIISLTSAWTNGWVNNGDAGDLRHHRAHYDIIVMLGWTTKRRLSKNQDSPTLFGIVYIIDTHAIQWNGNVVSLMDFHGWLRWKLLFWHFLVHPLLKISSISRHFCFIGWSPMIMHTISVFTKLFFPVMTRYECVWKFRVRITLLLSCCGFVVKIVLYSTVIYWLSTVLTKKNCIACTVSEWTYIYASMALHKPVVSPDCQQYGDITVLH